MDEHDTSWVTAEGGALDRVAVFCAVLLGLCALAMVVVTVTTREWVSVGFWLVVLAGCGAVGLKAGRRVRALSRRGPT